MPTPHGLIAVKAIADSVMVNSPVLVVLELEASRPAPSRLGDTERQSAEQEGSTTCLS